jgi:hypothetical protein
VQRGSRHPGKSPEHCVRERVPRNSTIRCSQIARSYIRTNWSRVLLQRSIHIFRAIRPINRSPVQTRIRLVAALSS